MKPPGADTIMIEVSLVVRTALFTTNASKDENYE